MHNVHSISADEVVVESGAAKAKTDWLLQGMTLGNASRAHGKLGWHQTTTLTQLVNEMVDADLVVAAQLCLPAD